MMEKQHDNRKAKIGPINLDYIRMAADEDEQVALELIGLLCQHIPAMMDELKLQYDNSDRVQLKRAAHRIKPTIALLKIPYFQQLIESIETRSVNETDFNSLSNMVEEAVTIGNDVVYQLKEQQQKLNKQ